jgi:hypothetical protein
VCVCVLQIKMGHAGYIVGFVVMITSADIKEHYSSGTSN